MANLSRSNVAPDGDNYAPDNQSVIMAQNPTITLYVLTGDPSKKLLVCCRREDTIHQLSQSIANIYLKTFVIPELSASLHGTFDDNNDHFYEHGENNYVRVNYLDVDGFRLPAQHRVGDLLEDKATVEAEVALFEEGLRRGVGRPRKKPMTELLGYRTQRGRKRREPQMKIVGSDLKKLKQEQSQIKQESKAKRVVEESDSSEEQIVMPKKTMKKVKAPNRKSKGKVPLDSSDSDSDIPVKAMPRGKTTASLFGNDVQKKKKVLDDSEEEVVVPKRVNNLGVHLQSKPIAKPVAAFGAVPTNSLFFQNAKPMPKPQKKIVEESDDDTSEEEIQRKIQQNIVQTKSRAKKVPVFDNGTSSEKKKSESSSDEDLTIRKGSIVPWTQPQQKPEPKKAILSKSDSSDEEYFGGKIEKKAQEENKMELEEAKPNGHGIKPLEKKNSQAMEIEDPAGKKTNDDGDSSDEERKRLVEELYGKKNSFAEQPTQILPLRTNQEVVEKISSQNSHLKVPVLTPQMFEDKGKKSVDVKGKNVKADSDSSGSSLMTPAKLAELKDNLNEAYIRNSPKPKSAAKKIYHSSSDTSSDADLKLDLKQNKKKTNLFG